VPGLIWLLEFKPGTVPKCQAECNRARARLHLTDPLMGSERRKVESAATGEPA
jgi:hypothetical protein